MRADAFTARLVAALARNTPAFHPNHRAGGDRLRSVIAALARTPRIPRAPTTSAPEPSPRPQINRSGSGLNHDASSIDGPLPHWIDYTSGYYGSGWSSDPNTRRHPGGFGSIAEMERAVQEREDLSGIDLSTASLPGAYLAGAILARADMSRADLRGAILVRALLVHANLTGADLTAVQLMDANLDDADLTGARLVDADLTRVAVKFRMNLADADLDGAKLVEINFSFGDTGHRKDVDAEWFMHVVRLDGARWTDATVWPDGVVERIRARSRESEPGVYEILPEDNEQPHPVG